MGTQDFGILITQPGGDATNPAANQVVLNTDNPFIKIDTQNKAGFQTILLLITNDPPEPVAPATDAYTVVYKFKHGYTYVPSLETIFNVVTLPPSGSGTQLYFQDSGLLCAHTFDDSAYIYAVADNAWVYFIVHKNNGQSGIGRPNLLTGVSINITTHVFVESVG